MFLQYAKIICENLSNFFRKSNECTSVFNNFYDFFELTDRDYLLVHGFSENHIILSWFFSIYTFLTKEGFDTRDD